MTSFGDKVKVYINAHKELTFVLPPSTPKWEVDAIREKIHPAKETSNDLFGIVMVK